MNTVDYERKNKILEFFANEANFMEFQCNCRILAYTNNSIIFYDFIE